MAEVVVDASALVDLLVDKELLAAWSRRHRLRLADALYVELASSTG